MVHISTKTGATGQSKIVSADSHVSEPPDLWLKELPLSFREQAPRVVRDDEDAGDIFVCPGAPSRYIYPSFAAGLTPAELEQAKSLGYQRAPKSLWHASDRIAEQERDNIDGEVLYPTLTDLVFSIPDHKLRLACLRVYNDYIADYCNAVPSRLKGLSVIDLSDIVLARSELARCQQLGTRGVILSAPNFETTNEAIESYRPFFAMMNELRMAICIHRGALRKDINVNPAGALVDYSLIPVQAQKIISSLIFHGIFAQFPDIKLVFAEYDISWIQSFFERVNYALKKYGGFLPISTANTGLCVNDLPIYFTVQEYSQAAGNLLQSEYRNMFMWASDYPHADSTWPNSQSAIDRLCRSLSSQARNELLFSRCNDLFKLDMAASQ